MSVRLMTFLIYVLLVGGAASAQAAGRADVVRDLAARVGPIIGSASACQDIARLRIEFIFEKFAAVIRDSASNDAERDDLARQLDRNIADGRLAVTTGRTDCKTAGRQLADLEQSLKTPASQAAVEPTLAAVPPAPTPALPAAPAPTAALPAAPTPVAALPAATAPVAASPGSPIRGISDQEVRFGMAAPFSGAAKELGRQMKLGIDTAFSQINDAGGVEGRMLRLIAADDGYEPTRTGNAMKQLYEKDQVFGFIGNVGTPTASVAVPFALERRMLFFSPFSGAGILRHDPPDRYVFNYRASYAEETDAAVHYLVKLRRIPPKQIAVFAQQDSYGDAGFAGVAKAYRALGISDSAIVRLNYKRNTVDVDEAINQLKVLKPAIKAVVMVATYRAATKFIEKTRDLFPGMVYTNVSFVGSTALADELTLLGPRFANGVIVTQVVPAVGGYSSAVLEYKNALAKYFPGEAPDYVSLEGYIAAKLLIQAMKRVGPQLDTEKLIDTLEDLHNFDLGLGATLGFGRSEHQASHKIWGTALDENGKFQPIDLE
jgi:ABC-type branched-subunit amino acid transport system substrate-binding protein